jgi:hypothetical protein
VFEKVWDFGVPRIELVVGGPDDLGERELLAAVEPAGEAGLLELRNSSELLRLNISLYGATLL